MIYDSGTLSVLIVSATDKSSEYIKSFLPQRSYSPIMSASCVGEAKRLMQSSDYDIIIINSPLKDESGIDFSIDIAVSTFSGVFLLIKSELYSEVSHKVSEFGVICSSKPLQHGMLTEIINLLHATRKRLINAESKMTALRNKTSEIRMVCRAKCLLVEKEGISESEAHRKIEKTAMDRCVKIRQIAEEIINRYS